LPNGWKRKAIQAKLFIDATGDGDIAVEVEALEVVLRDVTPFCDAVVFLLLLLLE
jgi:hypothetical protein